MSFIQAFERGIWKSWVIIFPLLVIHTVSKRILRLRGTGSQTGIIMILLFLILHILPIFMSLKLNTIWLFF